MQNEEFEKLVVDLVQPNQQFIPSAHYDEDGNCVEFLSQQKTISQNALILKL